MSKRLEFGERITRLHLNSNRNPRFAVDTLAGRFTLILVLRDLADAAAVAALDAAEAASSADLSRIIAVLATDAQAQAHEQIGRIARSKIVFWDPEERSLEAWRLSAPPPGCWLLLDPTLRVLAILPLSAAEAAVSALRSAPAPDDHAGVPLHAPVLVAPRIFEPAFCRRLIDVYEQQGGKPSGTTKENESGVTYVSLDDAFKRRCDYSIADQGLRREAMRRVFWRLLPEVEKAFAYQATRMERYIVSCYDAAEGGFFRAHRDNTTKGTAHRRFAVTINLNAEDYEGGELVFPEFGSRTYRPPTGGAVVFSCSLLHEATPVTRGKRYAFLPFLYDESAARIRVENDKHLDPSIKYTA